MASKAKTKKKQASGVLLSAAQLRDVAFSPNGRWLATTDSQQHISVWNAETGTLAWSTTAGGKGLKFVRSIAFSPDSERLAGGSSSIKLYDVASGTEQPGPEGHPKGELTQLEWTTDFLLSLSSVNVQGADRSVAFWNSADGTFPLLKRWKWDLPTGFAVSADALFIAGRVGAYGTPFEIKRFDRLGEQETARTEFEEPPPLFAATRSAVWLSTHDHRLVKLDANTLHSLELPKLEGRVVGLTDGSIFTADAMTIRRYDENGALLTTFELPEIPGGDAYAAELKAAAGPRNYDLFDLRFVSQARVQAGCVVLATSLSMYVFLLDGKPVLLPSLTA